MQSDPSGSKPPAPTETTPMQERDVCAPAPHYVSDGWVEFPQERDVCAPAPHYVSDGWVEFPVELWGQRVFLFIGTRTAMQDDFERYFYGRAAVCGVVENWLRRHPSNDSHTDGDTFGDSGLVFIRKDSFLIGDLDDLAILSHECLHAANGILRDVGVMGDDNVEVLAYTQEYIFKGLMKNIMSGKISPIGGNRDPSMRSLPQP